MKAREPGWPLPGGGDTSPLETLALVALAGLAVVAGVVWATGEIAGRVFGGAWPETGASELGRVLVHLASDPADPASAWPDPARELLPGPVGFYVVGAGVIAPLGVAAVLVLRARAARAEQRRPPAARWATTRDLRSLRVSRAAHGRLVLGRVDGHLVAAEARQSAIVIGPTQTGKTTGLAVPAILEWDGPVVATSVKTDLLDDTVARRTELGNVWVYDPTSGTGLGSAGWTPLAGCHSWRGAQQVASWLVGAARTERSGLEDGDFWYAASAKLLAPMLFAAAITGRPMADVVRWVDTQDEPEVLAMLDLTDVIAAVDAFQATTMRDPKTKSGVYTTAETVLAAYADPGVLATAERADLRPERLLDGGSHTAYICAPAHEQQRLRPLLATVVQEIVAAVYTRATATGKPLDPPLLLVLDECANIAPLRDLATIASTGAGQGLQLVSVFQDATQISAVYGRERASTILSNHRAKIVLTGIADSATLDYMGRLLGDEEVRLTSETSGGEGRRSTTESMGFRNLAPAHVLREMRPGSGLLVYGHLPPAKLELRPWFRDRALRRLATEGAEA